MFKKSYLRLGISLVILAGFISFSLTAIFTPNKLVMVLGDSSRAWDLNTAGDYTYDLDKIEFSSGVAQLKAQYTPSADWIANDGGGNSWLYRKQITITNTGGLAQTDYQVLMTIDTTGDKIEDDCDDLRFTTSDGATSISYWFEPGTCNTASTKVWVKVPSVAAPPDTTTIYMYYGNTAASAASAVATTFIREIANTAGSWMFNEGSGSVAYDTSGSGNNGDFASAGASPTWATDAERGTALSFDGSDYASLAAPNSELNLGDVLTIEAWIKPSDTTRRTIFSHGANAGGGFQLEINAFGGGSFGTIIAGIYTSYTAASQFATGAWIHLVYTRTGSGAGTHKLYLNGSSKALSNDNVNSYTDQTGVDIIGGRTTGSQLFNGSMDNVRIYGSALSQEEITDLYNNAGYTTTNYSGKTLVRKLTLVEPTASAGSEAGIYPTTNPTLVPDTGQGYSTLSGFTETLGGGSTGTIKYQISPDDGSTWYWYTGGAWTVTSAGYTESNIASDINTHLADESFNSIGSDPKTFLWRAYLNSDSTQLPKLDNIALEYTWDTADPDNPTPITSLSQLGGVAITTDTWYNHAGPYFSWDEPTDNAGEGEEASGVAGYYVYFGTTATADPSASGSYQTETTFTASSLVSGSSYYLRIETKDNAGNINDLAPEDPSLFIYKYDSINPTSPVYVSVSPSGYTRTNSFTFSWPITGENAATDTGGSALAGYNYKINSGAWSDLITGGSLELSDVAATGVNVFYLRAVDNATGYDLTPVQTNFYFNNSAPTAPTNLEVTPTTSAINSFAFSWGLPLSYSGSIDGYYYSINALPTLSNTSYTTSTSLGADAYATQQGTNTFYIVAKDESGNYDLNSCQSIQGNPTTDSCAKVEFIANTSAPGVPTAAQIFDISNRDTGDYAVTIKWTAPTYQGAGFSGYEVYRSTGSGYQSIGSTTGTTYADTDLSSQLYYYYVRSKDNAGQYSAPSSIVSITPTGKYTSPPTIVAAPKITISSYSAVITWQTDREGSSFIEYGLGIAGLGTANGGETKGQLEQTMDHSVSLNGLQPNTTYYYQAVWVDVDGNRGASDILSFLTKPAPRVTDLDSKTNISLNSILVNWSTTVTAYCVLNYGESVDYGGILREPVGTLSSTHSLNLTSLDHSTTYHFQINCLDNENNVFSSDDYKETTLTMPLITDFRFETIDAPTTTVKFTWKTNVATTSVATYQAGDGPVQSQSSADYKTEHEVIVPNLLDKTTYIFQAKGVDEHGNTATSDNNTFTTPDDTRPPKLTDMTVEVRTSGFGEAQKAQVIVAWQTDESSTSQVEYSQGISGQDYNFKSKEDTALATNHVVIVSDLEPSKIYHLRAISKDNAKNMGTSEDTTVITGKVQKSVIDIIINSLDTSLGWLFRIFQ